MADDFAHQNRYKNGGGIIHYYFNKDDYLVLVS